MDKEIIPKYLIFFRRFKIVFLLLFLISFSIPVFNYLDNKSQKTFKSNIDSKINKSITSYVPKPAIDREFYRLIEQIKNIDLDTLIDFTQLKEKILSNILLKEQYILYNKDDSLLFKTIILDYYDNSDYSMIIDSIADAENLYIYKSNNYYITSRRINDTDKIEINVSSDNREYSKLLATHLPLIVACKLCNESRSENIIKIDSLYTEIYAAKESINKLDVKISVIADSISKNEQHQRISYIGVDTRDQILAENKKLIHLNIDFDFQRQIYYKTSQQYLEFYKDYTEYCKYLPSEISEATIKEKKTLSFILMYSFLLALSVTLLVISFSLTIIYIKILINNEVKNTF